MATVCVTGAGGYVASWLVCKLLDKGYTVHGTVRDPEKCGHLKEFEGASERLTLFTADLLDFESLLPAIRGCHGVFHTACPVAPNFDNPDDVLRPAIDGTRNLLQACSQENVKHIVMTSSAAAIVASTTRPNGKVIDENCWSDPDYCREAKLWYRLAKTESEKLAWELSKEHKLNLVVVCPGLVLGPFLQPTVNQSVNHIRELVDGSAQACPNRYTHVVDVRDTAEAHIAAFENPNASGRYYCFGYVVHYRDMVELLKKHFPKLRFPDSLDGELSEELKYASNDKLRTLIKELVPLEQFLVDTIHCLQERGFLPK